MREHAALSTEEDLYGVDFESSEMEQAHIKLVDRLYKELLSGSLGIFAGAGFSQGAGYVNWKELLRPIAVDLYLDVGRADRP